MPEFSFAAPLLKGKTEALKKAVAEMNGPRKAAHRESRKKLGITREHVSLQHTPMGDLAVVHLEATDPNVMAAMLASGSEFDTWFRNAVLVDTHGVDPKAAPPPPVEVILDYRG